jgi:hypothetical protein
MVRSAYLSWSRILIGVLLFAGAAHAQYALPALGSPAGGAFSGHYLDAISGSGSDSNNGLTPSTAWATLAHADSVLTTNDPTLHIRYPNGGYVSVAPVWHNFLSYYPLQQGTFSGASATTCYDVYNGHNGTLGGSGLGSNGPIWKYAGMVISDGAYCSIPNFSNFGPTSTGAVISVQTNLYDTAQATWVGSAFGMNTGGTYFWFGNPYSTGTNVYFDFNANVTGSVVQASIANQQHVWGALCGGGHQYIYLDSTQNASASNTCSFSGSSVALLLGYASGNSFGMAGVLSGTMITDSTLATTDYGTLEAWFNSTEIPRIQHAPAPTQPGTQAKPRMEWNSFGAYNTSATCADIKANALAATTDGILPVGYNTFNVPVPWATGRSGGTLTTDATKCPLGIADLFAYFHSLGELASHYLSPGSTGCVGQPGSGGSETTDANQAASFGYDRLSYDNCTTLSTPQADYQTMSTAMIAAGRPASLLVSDGAYGDNSACWCPAVGGVEIQTGEGTAPPITWSSVLSDAGQMDSFSTIPWSHGSPTCFPWIDNLGVGGGSLTDQEGQSDFSIFAT